jgi:Flp pilus assembly protein CpaB
VQFAQRLLSTRAGTLAVAGFAAVLAAMIFLVYLNRYRNSLNDSSTQTSVLVANGFIAKGTAGDAVGTGGLYQVMSRAKGQLVDGALSDPAGLRGLVATRDIYEGQQLSSSDFSSVGSASVGAQLIGEQRAMSIPLDSSHGMIGKIEAGDHVDVYAGFNLKRVDRNGVPVDNGQGRPVLKQILDDVTVLSVPSSSGGGLGAGNGGSVTLRVTPEAAANLAFSSDEGKIWLVLRPRSGGSGEAPPLVTAETLLLGVRPVVVMHSFGGRQ